MRQSLTLLFSTCTCNPAYEAFGVLNRKDVCLSVPVEPLKNSHGRESGVCLIKDVIKMRALSERGSTNHSVLTHSCYLLVQLWVPYENVQCRHQGNGENDSQSSIAKISNVCAIT